MGCYDTIEGIHSKNKLSYMVCHIGLLFGIYNVVEVGNRSWPYLAVLAGTFSYIWLFLILLVSIVFLAAGWNHLLNLLLLALLAANLSVMQANCSVGFLILAA